MIPSAAEVIAGLELRPHPEGGHYVETWRSAAKAGARPAGSAIYYLLAEGELSHWHRVDADEIWHYYQGAALELRLSVVGGTPSRHVLGGDIRAGQRPQIVVPAGVWQSARALGGWTLVGCTVSPGFQFSGFEMAPPEWHPSLDIVEAHS